MFLKTAGGPVAPAAREFRLPPRPAQPWNRAPIPSTSKQSDSDQRPIKIVPKGLRSFDEHDADFFLELLPGPRDRDGLPESIRFWKRRIEQLDPDLTFKVGLIYGPSGCGKSSLVKAGLLPRLGNHVLRSTSRRPRRRRKPGCSRACARPVPNCRTDWGWLMRWRSSAGSHLPPGAKVLLVLDQFEQWLHAKRGEENTELVAALRQCDGEHVSSDRAGPGRLLAGREPLHEGPGDRLWCRTRTSLSSISSIPPCPESADGIRASPTGPCPSARAKSQRISTPF